MIIGSSSVRGIIRVIVVRNVQVLWVLLLWSIQAEAWDNNIVHPEITKKAIELVSDINELVRYRDFNSYSECSRIVEGAVKEDMTFLSEVSWDTSIWGDSNCGLLGLNCENHSYNPETGDGWSQCYDWMKCDNTVSYAFPIWTRSQDDHNSGNYNVAYFALGRICHLLEDMSSPPHVHGDVHLLGDDVENWGKKHWGESYFVISVANLDPCIPEGNVSLPDGSIVAGSSVQGFLHTLARFTYNLSSFQGELYEDIKSQPNSELKKMFPSLHYDILFGCWEIDDVGSYDGLFSDEWWPCKGDYTEDNNGPGGVHRLVGNFYIEDTKAAKPKWFDKPLHNSSFTRGLTLPENMPPSFGPSVSNIVPAFCVSIVSRLAQIHRLEDVTPIHPLTLNQLISGSSSPSLPKCSLAAFTSPQARMKRCSSRLPIQNLTSKRQLKPVEPASNQPKNNRYVFPFAFPQKKLELADVEEHNGIRYGI